MAKGHVAQWHVTTLFRLPRELKPPVLVLLYGVPVKVGVSSGWLLLYDYTYSSTKLNLHYDGLPRNLNTFLFKNNNNAGWDFFRRVHLRASTTTHGLIILYLIITIYILKHYVYQLATGVIHFLISEIEKSKDQTHQPT